MKIRTYVKPVSLITFIAAASILINQKSAPPQIKSVHVRSQKTNPDLSKESPKRFPMKTKKDAIRSETTPNKRPSTSQLAYADSHLKLDVYIEAENEDIKWSKHVFNQLRDFQSGLEGSHLISHRCGSSLCRAEFTHSSRLELEKFRHYAPITAPFQTRMRMETMIDATANEGARLKSIVHFWRAPSTSLE